MVSKELIKESHENSIYFPSLDVVKSLFIQPLAFLSKAIYKWEF